MKKEKVFIIGYDLISPIATGIENLHANLVSNYCGEKILQRTDTSGIPYKTGAEVQTELQKFYKNESPLIQEICAIDRKLELLAACTGLLKEKINHLTESCNRNRLGIILGVGAEATPYEFYKDEIKKFLHHKTNALNELMTHLKKEGEKIQLLNNPYDVYAHYLGEKFKANGIRQSILTACVSSTQAIAFAYDTISRGQQDVIISGGTDSILNLSALMAFGKLGVISDSDKHPTCRPFDVNRLGTIAGEAAGIILLASENFITQQKTQPIAEITGYGNTMDAYKITSPDPSGKAMAKAISEALHNSTINASAIDYIQAHGTGTQQNDETELKAIETAFGNFSRDVLISGTKDRHGHAIAAAGVQEVCVLLENMKNNFIPANLNLQNPIRTDMKLVKQNQVHKINYALSNNFAFGGINTVLAFKNEMK